MVVVVSGSCHATTKEVQRTTVVCFKLIQTLNKSGQSDAVRDELLLLAKQASMERLHFTAAGFFNVDYTMLYILLSSITSYIVVLFQFKK